MSSENRVGIIEEKKSFLGRIYYKFNNQEYKTAGEAEQARAIELKRIGNIANQEKILKQIESILNDKRKIYDENPVYLSMSVSCSYIPYDDIKELHSPSN